MDDFYRIKRLPPYLFQQINSLKADLRSKNADIIDFGMGNPDLPTPSHIVDKLCETARQPGTNRYSASRGIKGLRKAMASYYDRRFGVKLDHDREIVATLGSKEGFANLALAISAPGDVVLIPNPSYPLHQFGFIIAGAVVRSINALDPENYLRGMSRAIKHSVPSPIAMVLCHPSNPTAAVVDLDFYREAVQFAKKNDLFILSDLAYSEIYFVDPPPSVLQVEGAKDIAVEVNSLSKTYAMAGWRVGFAVGNERLVGALSRVKSYLDYGAYTPIQVAAATALNADQSCVDQMRETYRSRRDVLVNSFTASGWDIPPPQASMFAWAPLPEKFREMGSYKFAQKLMREAQIAVSPGVGFGEFGEGYVRIALVENEQRIRQAARNLKKFMHS